MASALIVEGSGGSNKIGRTSDLMSPLQGTASNLTKKGGTASVGTQNALRHPGFQSAAIPERRTVPKVSARTSLLQMRHTDFAQSEFVERLKGHDQTALTELVEAYLPQLLRAGRGMGFSREESEDLAQSVFTACIEGLDRFEGRSHVRTFLFGIFYHKVSEHLRDLKRAQQFDPIDEVMETKFDAEGNWRQPPVDIEKQLLAQETGQIIRDCLEEIPQAQRIVFYLREVEQMETPDICNKMGISSTNCGVLLFRARNRLRECLAKRGLAKGVRGAFVA